MLLWKAFSNMKIFQLIQRLFENKLQQKIDFQLKSYCGVT